SLFYLTGVAVMAVGICAAMATVSHRDTAEVDSASVTNTPPINFPHNLPAEQAVPRAVELSIAVPPNSIQQKSWKRHLTNKSGMNFVWISPGSYVMGSPLEEKERAIDETQHMVTLTKGFYMGVHTVTQEQWYAVMNINPSKFQGQENLPVEQVSW